MASITLVDDDYAAEILAESLRALGHDVALLRSTGEALQECEQLAASELVMLDIMMPPGAGSATNGRTAGMRVYRELRRLKPELPIIVYTASSDQDVHAVLDRDSHTHVLMKWAAPSIREVIDHVERMLGTSPTRRPCTFIVHGRDERCKLDLKNYLQNTLRFPEPIILHEQPSAGRTIIEKFEYYAGDSELVFVLLTPDDIAAPTDAPNDEKRRSRQNVILELGFFLGALGRLSGRVFLLYKPPLELPGDLGGVVYIDIGSGIEAAGESIRREIDHALR